MNIADRLSKLRTAMKANGLDAYIIPSNDPHQSEYVADHWKTKTWISNFTGSAGVIVVTLQHAGLWTDSRYFLQGEMELKDSEFVLHKVYNQFGDTYMDWICENLPSGSKVGYDAWLLTAGQASSFKSKLADNKLELIVEHDLIKETWENRPQIPENVIFLHDIKYSGKSTRDKIEDVRKVVQSKKADYHLITTLDDIAWLFNIRCNDVEFNPVAIAYALIGKNDSILFINENKVSKDLQDKFGQINIRIKAYEDIVVHLGQLPADGAMLVDKSSCNLSLFNAIGCEKKINQTMPSRLMKALKNETEIAHLKQVMVKDAIAIAKTFYWLDNNIDSSKISEFDFAEKLAFHRSLEENYFGESFPAIIGYKGNGAIIHYRPHADTASVIKSDGVLLADSGGQYFDGTTDITRTVALGPIGDEEKDAYTRVLKGHIGLASAKFPKGTTGGQLDILARKPLWDNGLNYLHGTGHGVGFFLNVHEPPQGFAPGTSSRATTKLEPGMYSSNEPGFYKENAFGIRIENLMITIEAKEAGFLEHETITLYPIDKKMIDAQMLTDDEKSWLNAYHAEVDEKVTPHLDEEMKAWFKSQCEPIN